MVSSGNEAADVKIPLRLFLLQPEGEGLQWLKNEDIEKTWLINSSWYFMMDR
jgi:hypothetical protein